MEQVPDFLKEFSKSNFSEERNKTAQDIKIARKERFDSREKRKEEKTEIQKNTEEKEKSLEFKLEELKKLAATIEDLSQNGVDRILNYLKIRKLRAELVLGNKTYEELKEETGKGIEANKNQLQKLDEEENQEPLKYQKEKEMLDNFYKDQKDKWASSEYTKEDITKYFNEEYLSKLNLEDYSLLLKRFPSEMVTHVTRQGIRDHVGHQYHTAGEGQFSDGFVKIIEDGHLRSPLGIHLNNKNKEEAIADFLHIKEYKAEFKDKAKDQVLYKLDSMDARDQYGFTDAMAIHFAGEMVADEYYGAEKGNEIFFVFPSAQVASQYYFNGPGYVEKKNSQSESNDLWVWEKEQKGIDINSGITFIPGETLVNPENGSKYELDENKYPIINQDNIDTIKKLFDSPKFNEFFMQVTEKNEEFVHKEGGSYDLYSNQKLFDKLKSFCAQLDSDFGIKDINIQKSLLYEQNIYNLHEWKNKKSFDKSTTLELTIIRILKEAGSLYVKTKNAISSKEYWENYFVKHPEQKPNKIVYYKEEDPTRALNSWRNFKGVIKQNNEKDLGFSERRISRKDSPVVAEYGRFQSLAEEVMSKYFGQSEKEDKVNVA